MAGASKKALVKIRKKRWFSVNAPKAFNEVIIGEIPAYEPQDIVGRTITVNLMFLLNDPKKQNAKITFKVLAIEDNRTLSEISHYEILPSFIRRLVRRGKCRMDHSSVLRTKDGQFIRIKPFLLTRTMTTSSVTKKLQKRMREGVLRWVQNSSYDQLMRDIITGKLQMTLRGELNKIFPISVMEIRVVKKTVPPIGYVPPVVPAPVEVKAPPPKEETAPPAPPAPATPQETKDESPAEQA